MLNTKRTIVILTILAAVACAKKDNPSTPAANPAPNSGATAPKDLTPAQPEPGAQPSQQVLPSDNGKNDKKPVKKTADSQQGQREASGSNSKQASQSQSQAKQGTQAKSQEKSQSAPAAQRKVVGLGSNNKDPKELLDRGYKAAVFEARFCSISGKFSDGTECYLVFDDGKTEYANATNRDEVLPFIDQLKATADAQDAQKKKAKQKKTN